MRDVSCSGSSVLPWRCDISGCCAELSARAADGALHMCFELTQHGESLARILPDLSAALQQDTALLHAGLPSMALLAQLSTQHAADAIMGHMLKMCIRLDSLPPAVRGSPAKCHSSSIFLLCSQWNCRVFCMSSNIMLVLAV